MAVPVAKPIAVRYKDVLYNVNETITITELHPVLEVVYDNIDFTNSYDVAYNPSETVWGSNYYYQMWRGGGVRVDEYTISRRFDFITDTHDILTLRAYNEDGAGTAVSWAIVINLSSGVDDSWQYLASTIIRDTLIANLDAESLATITENSIIKIVWEDVNEKWSQPYIVTQIITGGDLNSAQVPYAEMLWRIVVHTPNHATAGLMENAIHKALARKFPVINFSDITASGYIEETTPVTDRYQVQNVPILVSGGIYRIRLAKG